MDRPVVAVGDEGARLVQPGQAPLHVVREDELADLRVAGESADLRGPRVEPRADALGGFGDRVVGDEQVGATRPREASWWVPDAVPWCIWRQSLRARVETGEERKRYSAR